MQTIRDLIIASKTNPAHLKQLEISITNLSADILEYQTLTYLFQDNNFECKFYGTIILQKRLKHVYKAKNADIITAFVHFVNFAYEQIANVHNDTNNNILSNKMADIYALTIIYYYPVHNTNIFTLILNAIQSKMLIGYLILQKFLFFLNTSSEITNDRRVELRKLCKENVTALLEECKTGNTNTTRITIQIYTNALSHIKEKHTSMFEYVLKAGKEYANETLDFLSEYTQLYCTLEQTNRILEYAKETENDFSYKIIEIFMQNKELCKNINLLNFVLLKAKNDVFFDLCIEFLTKFYKNHATDEKYTRFTLDAINTIKDCRLDGKAEDLIRLMASKYTQVTLHILTNYCNEVPLNILVILLDRCSLKKEYVFSNDFLNCYSEYKRNDTSCIRYLQAVNYDNKESVKFTIKILKKYKVEQQIINYILSNVNNKKAEYDIQSNTVLSDLLDDLMITCILTLLKTNDNNDLDLVPYISTPSNTIWDDGRKKRFLCFLRKDVKTTQRYFESFYTHFMNQAIIKENDLTILAVMQKHYTQLPQEMLVKIYNNIKMYETKELCVLLNELLPLMTDQITKTFIENIYNKIMLDCNEEVSLIKSYLNFIDRQIIKQINNQHIFNDANDEYLSFYTNLLIESLLIKEHSVPRKVHEILQKNNLCVSKNKQNISNNIMYKLLMLYNDSEMTDAQNDILAFLIYMIQNTEDLSVLQIVPQVTQEQIENLRISLQHGTTKNKKDVLREFLKEVKGKAMHELFSDNVTVQKMGFTVQKKEVSENVNVSDFYK